MTIAAGDWEEVINVKAIGLKLGFDIKGYPGTGRRVEFEESLANVYDMTILQGAFTGDAIFEIEGIDFSTHSGTETLFSWCGGLAGAMRRLDLSGSSFMKFTQSDDFVSFRLHGDAVYAACSYVPGIASVKDGTFRKVVRAFLDDQLSWISVNFPEALQHPALIPMLRRTGWQP
jgi:hypothetical protein